MLHSHTIMYSKPWSVLQSQPPEWHLLLKVDRAETIHHPQDLTAVKVEDVVEKHGVSVEKELVVLNIVIVAERHALDRIITEGKHSDPGFWILEDQMLRDVKHLSTHVEVDDVRLPRVGCLFALSFFLNICVVRSVKGLHGRPWFHRAGLCKREISLLFFDALRNAWIPFYGCKKTGATLFQHFQLWPHVLHFDRSLEDNRAKEKLCQAQIKSVKRNNKVLHKISIQVEYCPLKSNIRLK